MEQYNKPALYILHLKYKSSVHFVKLPLF